MPEEHEVNPTEQERASRPLSARQQNRRDLARMRGERQAREREKAGGLEHFAETLEGLPKELQERVTEAKQRREASEIAARERAGKEG